MFGIQAGFVVANFFLYKTGVQNVEEYCCHNVCGVVLFIYIAKVAER
jgi:hypothetical protein